MRNFTANFVRGYPPDNVIGNPLILFILLCRGDGV